MPLFAQQMKEHDFDVIYAEDKVPPYILPHLLESAEGKMITTSDAWHQVRRPQIISLFSNLIYGRVPVAKDSIQTNFNSQSYDAAFLTGQATKKLVQINFSNEKGTDTMEVLVIRPKHSTGPTPALLQINFDAAKSDKMQLNRSDPGHFRSGIPIGKIIESGFAYVSIYHQDLIAHNETDFRNSVQQLFFQDGQSFPKGHEWGVIATIAWSASRALDYLHTDPTIDAGRVAILGHSKLGKAALWAAAQDQRFALVISAQSGCGGAALWRRKFGETLAKISVFPHWLCTNARKFIHREDDLPLDQHMLLGLIAPRPLYIASAENDLWADPHGEYLSAFHASQVYHLLGRKGLQERALPPLNQPILTRDVGHHIRTGGHRVENYDWEQFLTFMQHHLK